MIGLDSEELHGSEKHNLGERPQLNWEALHLADEDRRYHQHGGQVHAQSCLKEERLEEGGGVGDQHEEEGGEVGGHHLAHDLSFQL